jgi:hypothetical protein
MCAQTSRGCAFGCRRLRPWAGSGGAALWVRGLYAGDLEERVVERRPSDDLGRRVCRLRRSGCVRVPRPAARPGVLPLPFAGHASA